MKFEWTVSPHYGPTAPMKSVQPHLMLMLKAFTYTHLSHKYKCNSYLSLTKKSLVGGTCCVHRLSYFINNVKHTGVLHDGSEQLTGCKEAPSPHCLTSVTTWPTRQRVATTHHHATGRVSALCCITAPFPQLGKKNPYKLQLSNTELSPSEISLQPLQKMWESRQNKNLQTSHLWCWHGFLLVFSSVQEKKIKIVPPIESFPYFQLWEFTRNQVELHWLWSQQILRVQKSPQKIMEWGWGKSIHPSALKLAWKKQNEQTARVCHVFALLMASCSNLF